MRESDLLRHIYERSRSLGNDAGIVVGPGDDCAVLETERGDHLLVTTDQLIEGRHYRAATAVDLIARKAVARSVSDIAATAGRPLWSLATAAIPKSFDHANELFDRMAYWASHWSCPLVGGDISATDGPLTLTTTVIGNPIAHPVLRSSAAAGQGVYVTGRLGGSLDSGRHLTFEPRLKEAAALLEALGDRFGAMIDLSDGLGRDAGRIAEASSVRIELDAASIPLAPGVATWRDACADGEDYELCFTATGEVPGTIVETPITRVGRVIEGSGCVAREGEQLIDAAELGWDHPL